MTPYYERDGIVLFNADCREVLPTLAAVDHVITDPPYSRDLYLKFRTNGHAAKARRAGGFETYLALANEDIGAIEDLLPFVAPEIIRLARRWMIAFHDAEHGQHLWREAFGPLFVRSGVWIKLNPMPQISGDRPGVGYEMATIAHADGRKRWNGGGRAAVWTHSGLNSRDNERPDHPCPKPLPLMRELVELFTDPGETILDPFAGSGTTGVAAYQLGRKAILVELAERWCEVAAKRLEAQTPPMPLEFAPAPEQAAML